MAKKVPIAAKPTKRPEPPVTADEWVARGAAPAEATTPEAKPAKEELTRFTIDIPVSLHRRIKSQCAGRGVKMREEILALLEKHFGG